MQQYRKTDMHLLSQKLAEIHRHTTLFPVDSPAEFQLNLDGTTKQGWRLTHTAFAQVAKMIGPGVSKCITDLSGINPLPEAREGLFDGGLAIEMWNRLVDLRYPVLGSKRVIRNEKTQLIEGLIGHKHQFLDNLTLYEQSIDSVANFQPDQELYAARLVGRRLALWFRDKNPMFSAPYGEDDWPYRRGCFFLNGEATGTSVRGTLALFTRAGVCLSPKHSVKLPHSGRDFQTRLGSMFASVSSCEVDVEKLEQQAQTLEAKSLGFTTEMGEQERKKHRKLLIALLSQLDVEKSTAESVIDLAIASGRDAATGFVAPPRAPSAVAASRRLVDVFVPLLVTANKMELARREKLQTAAYQVLTGKFVV